MNSTNIQILAAMLLTLAFMASGASATSPQQMSVDDLKRFYLDCERDARAGLISTGEVMHCSVVYEELKIRAFDGNWIRVWEWTKQNLGQGEEA